MALLCPPKMLKESFPNDRDYTFNALIEELFLVERHIRDNSWRICDCTPSKHLPGIAGLASEGYGFAEDLNERRFMECLMGQARLYKAMIEDGRIKNEEQFNQIRDWSRNARHMLSAKDWTGKQDIEEQLEYNNLTPVLAEAVTEVTGLRGGLMDIEERYVDEMLTRLAAKHGVPKPKYRFIEGCNPLVPQAWMVSSDLRFKSLKGEEIIVRPEHDELVFCRGQTAPYSVSHEFCHSLQRQKEGKTDERYATECGLAEVQTVETLNTLTLQDNNGGKMAKGKGQIIEQMKNTLPLAGGVLIGELIDEAGYIEQITSFAGTYSGLAKGVVGLGISAVGLGYLNGTMSEVMVGIGLPIAVSGFRNQFMGGISLGRSRLSTPTQAALEYAYPRGLTPYATPTGLRAGHPTLDVTKMGSRPGVLSPSMLPSGLSGKFNLGNR